MNLSLVELKSLAYDTLAQIQTLQGRLQEINQVIAKEAAKAPVVSAAVPVEANEDQVQAN